VENTSGKSFTDTRLKLIAGDLNLVEEIRPMLARSAGLDDMYEKGFSEKEFFEYHLYTLDRKTDLKDNQTKQIQLFSPAQVAVEKSYNYNYYEDEKKVRVLLGIMNSQENGLGIPLPKGKVRMYKEDGEDLEFIGEDRIDHTSRNEQINLELGKAFDITAERAVLKQSRISKRSEQLTVSVELNNHKNEDIVVVVTEPVPSGRSYRLIKSDITPFEQVARKINFKVPVPAGRSTTLTFEVLYSW
jgi:hypothetical protein